VFIVQRRIISRTQLTIQTSYVSYNPKLHLMSHITLISLHPKKTVEVFITLYMTIQYHASTISNFMMAKLNLKHTCNLTNIVSSEQPTSQSVDDEGWLELQMCMMLVAWCLLNEHQLGLAQLMPLWHFSAEQDCVR